MNLAISGAKPLRTKPFSVLPRIGPEEHQQLKEVLDDGLLSGFIAAPNDAFLGGKKVKRLEQLFKDFLGVPHAVAVNSATSGLHAALAAVGVKAGDEVICPPYTMSATAAAVLMQNAVPVFADIDPETFCLDPRKAEKKISPRTKAIIVVHLFGLPADMEGIMALAKKHKLFVIEDCAQSPGAEYRNQKVGTIGDIGVFSLNQHKIITTGEGGVCVTRNEKFAFRMQLVRNHGEVVLAEMKDRDPREDADIIGWNYRMPEMEAGIGIAQFGRLEELTSARIALAEELSRGLEKIPGIRVPKKPADRRHVYFVFPLFFEAAVWKIPRSFFLDALRAEGIPCAGGYVRPIYHQPLYQSKSADAFRLAENVPDYRKGDCPVTERCYAEDLVSLPVCRAPHTSEDIKDVVLAFEKLSKNLEELIAFAQAQLRQPSNV